ncbi:glutaminase [Nocardia sp. NPDC101769]|uniref:glutaminase n=1 Tax=Nocardia sp. NPDC101769 TaxID=3364333 RepID=UPI0038268A90
MSPVFATVYGAHSGPRCQERNATCNIRSRCEAQHRLRRLQWPGGPSGGVVARINDEVYELYRADTSGTLPDCIPELAAVQPDSFGICLATADGRMYGSGDLDAAFTIQSASSSSRAGQSPLRPVPRAGRSGRRPAARAFRPAHRSGPGDRTGTAGTAGGRRLHTGRCRRARRTAASDPPRAEPRPTPLVRSHDAARSRSRDQR